MNICHFRMVLCSRHYLNKHSFIIKEIYGTIFAEIVGVCLGEWQPSRSFYIQIYFRWFFIYRYMPFKVRVARQLLRNETCPATSEAFTWSARIYNVEGGFRYPFFPLQSMIFWIRDFKECISLLHHFLNFIEIKSYLSGLRIFSA